MIDQKTTSYKDFPVMDYFRDKSLRQARIIRWLLVVIALLASALGGLLWHQIGK